VVAHEIFNVAGQAQDNPYSQEGDMTWFVHVNKNTIASNRKHGKKEPAVRIQRGRRGKSIYCYRAKFVEGEIIYSPHEPLLPCGARMVIQTEHEPEVLE
jgi:hypothetical protein